MTINTLTANYIYCHIPNIYTEAHLILILLAGIKFGGWALNRHCKNTGGISGFKFGDSVRGRHTYTCKYEILADFNLAVASWGAKPPNLIPRQIFWRCVVSCMVLVYK